MEETIPGLSPNLGFTPLNPASQLPTGPTQWELDQEQKRREADATVGDYVGSIWRQDGLVDGFVADMVGKEMTPQPGYFAGTDPNWEDLRKGLWPEHENFLYQAHSPAHALFVKQRLLQKQEDLVRLGDMGLAGNVGRLAMNFLAPDALLMGMAGGWAARGIMTAQRVVKGGTALGKAVDAGEAVVRASKAPAIVGGVAFGAAENAAYEALRQSVNFEDDTGAVIENALFGAAFTTPFALMGARGASRLAAASERELRTLQTLKKVEDGVEITADEAKLLKETVETHKAIREFESGVLSREEFDAKMDALYKQAEDWQVEFDAKLKAQTEAFIAENFPNAGQPAPRVPRVSPEERAKMDARVARETEENFGAVSAPEPEPRPGVAGTPDVEAANARNPRLDGPLQSALKRHLTEQAEIRRQAEADATKREQLEKAWQRYETEKNARKIRELEAIRNAFELRRAEDPFAAPEATNVAPKAPEPEAPAKAPESPQEAPKGASPTEPHAAPKEPAQSGVARWVGREVSFMHPKTGESIDGKVIGEAKVPGKVIVEDSYTGNKVAADPRTFDQFDGDAPEGFLPGSIGAAQVAKIANVADQRTALSQLRLDYFAILNRSANPGVRSLAFKLIKDAIQTSDTDAQGWTASEHKKHIQRTVGGKFHREVDALYLEAANAAGVPMLQRPRFKTEFYALVSKVARDPNSPVLAAHQPIAPQLQAAAKAMREAYAEMLVLAQKAGVKGAKDVPPNDTYVNRLWDHARIREAELKHGRDAIIQLVANAIRVPGYQGDLVKAERFINTVKKLQFNQGLRDIHLQGRDMATLRGELQAHGLTQQEIDDLVDLMFAARAVAGADSGQAPRLKYRFDLDETVEMQTPGGTLRIDDLFENDSRVLVDTYINSMGGHIGLARVGIDSQATWEAKLRQIQDDAAQTAGVDGTRLAKELGYLRDIHSHITGRPMSTQDFSYSARAAQALRGYTRSVMLGQLGLTAAFEMNRAVSLLGARAVWASVPSFRQFIGALRRGYVPDTQLSRDILAMTGFGNDMAMSYARHHEVESGFAGGALTRFEQASNTVSHVTDIISGNATFTSLTRQITGQAAVRNAFDYASGNKKLTPAMRKRWVGQGLDDAEIDAVLADLRTYSKDNNGVLESIDYVGWQKAEPETYEKFQLFLTRQVRDAIQDQDIGETMPWMHTTLGKVFSELRTFMLVAHAKQFLKTAHYRDMTSVNIWLISFVAEMMAFSTQAAINYPERLDEFLTPEKIALGAIGRMSTLGVGSMLMEGAWVTATGGDSLFQEGMTGNTENRVPWKTPSYVVASRMINAVPTVVGAVTGNDTTTQREFKDAIRALPASRLYGLPALIDYLSADLPKQEVKDE